MYEYIHTHRTYKTTKTSQIKILQEQSYDKDEVSNNNPLNYI